MIKSIIGGNSNSINYLFYLYQDNLGNLVNLLLSYAVVYDLKQVILDLLNSGAEIKAENMEFIGKYCVVCENSYLIELISDRIASIDKFMFGLMNFAFDNSEYNFIRDLLDTWYSLETRNGTFLIDEMNLYQASFYASKIDYPEFIEMINESSEVGEFKINFKRLALLNDFNIFSDNFESLDKENIEDVMEALKVTKSFKIVRMMLVNVPGISYDSETASLIMVNLISEIKQRMDHDDFEQLCSLLTLIPSKSVNGLQKADLMKVLKESAKSEFPFIYRIFKPLNLVISSFMLEDLRQWIKKNEINNNFMSDFDMLVSHHRLISNEADITKFISMSNEDFNNYIEELENMNSLEKIIDESKKLPLEKVLVLMEHVANLNDEDLMDYFYFVHPELSYSKKI